jgi:hypothetical protein
MKEMRITFATFLVVFIATTFTSSSQEMRELAVATNKYCCVTLKFNSFPLLCMTNQAALYSSFGDEAFIAELVQDPCIKQLQQFLQGSEWNSWGEKSLKGKNPYLRKEYVNLLSQTNFYVFSLSVSNYGAQTSKMIWHRVGPEGGRPASPSNLFGYKDMKLVGPNIHLLYKKNGLTFVNSFLNPCKPDQKLQQTNIIKLIHIDIDDSVNGAVVGEAYFTNKNMILEATLEILNPKKQPEQETWLFRSNKWVKKGLFSN